MNPLLIKALEDEFDKLHEQFIDCEQRLEELTYQHKKQRDFRDKILAEMDAIKRVLDVC